MEDRANKRREYLRKKGLAWIHGSLGLAVAAVFVAAALWMLGVMNSPGYAEAVDGVGLAILALCIGFIIYGSVHCRDAAKNVKSIPYVPPVREQITALSADEILLRGSDHPVVAPHELLRVAHNRPETDTEELLRPTENIST
jgi:hypothetical protein